MVDALEGHIDALGERTAMPTEFVVPGENRVAAQLDVVPNVVVKVVEVWLSHLALTDVGSGLGIPLILPDPPVCPLHPLSLAA